MIKYYIIAQELKVSIKNRLGLSFIVKNLIKMTKAFRHITILHMQHLIYIKYTLKVKKWKEKFKANYSNYDLQLQV